MPTHKTNIRAHAAFVVIAALLSVQACGGPATAAPEDVAAAPTSGPVEHVSAASNVEAGRYLVKVSGCNDCHTPGYVEGIMMTGQAMPESDWLKGGDVGFSGPWGVSYPSNLRLSLQNMSEDQFIELSRAGEGRPPMPWPSLQAMSDRDLKAIYGYIKSLGPAGVAAPAALSPGVAPDRPHIRFVPEMPT
jgi:mono/diheme cytochrome c family protein